MTEEIVCKISGGLGLLKVEHRLGVELGVDGGAEGLTRLSVQLAVLKGMVNASLTELVGEESRATTASNKDQRRLLQEEEESADSGQMNVDRDGLQCIPTLLHVRCLN